MWDKEGEKTIRGRQREIEREGEIVSKHTLSVSFVASIQTKTSFGLLKISTPMLRMKHKLSFVIRFFLDQRDHIKRLLLYTLFSWFFYLFSLFLVFLYLLYLFLFFLYVSSLSLFSSIPLSLHSLFLFFLYLRYLSSLLYLFLFTLSFSLLPLPLLNLCLNKNSGHI